MDILVKVSGDLADNEKFYQWLLSTYNDHNKGTRFFILCGGGSAITETLKEHNIQYSFGQGGREIRSVEGRYLAKKVLDKQKSLVEQKLEEFGIIATTFTPVIELENKICHINGDNLVISLYPDFDDIFIVTLRGRIKHFPGFQKIKVINL